MTEKIGKNMGPGRLFITAGPLQYPEQEANTERGGAGNDLVFGQRGNEGAQGKQGARLQQQAQVAHGQRLPVRMAIAKEEGEINRGEQEQAGVKDHGRQPFSQG